MRRVVVVLLFLLVVGFSYGRAEALVQDGKWKEALALLKSERGEGWRYHYLLGRAYYGLEDYRAALKEFEEAQRSGGSDEWELLFWKGKTLLRLGEYRAASEVFDFLLGKWEEERTAVLFYSGVAHYYLGERSLALERFRTVVSEEPESRYGKAAADYISAAVESERWTRVEGFRAGYDNNVYYAPEDTVTDSSSPFAFSFLYLASPPRDVRFSAFASYVYYSDITDMSNFYAYLRAEKGSFGVSALPYVLDGDLVYFRAEVFGSARWNAGELRGYLASEDYDNGLYDGYDYGLRWAFSVESLRFNVFGGRRRRDGEDLRKGYWGAEVERVFRASPFSLRLRGGTRWELYEHAPDDSTGRREDFRWFLMFSLRRSIGRSVLGEIGVKYEERKSSFSSAEYDKVRWYAGVVTTF